MKTASCALQTHLAQENTTLAYLWKVTLRDGTRFGFTTHDQDIVYDDLTGSPPEGDLTYEALTGFANTAVSAKADLSVDNLEVTSFLDSDNISEADLRAGFWDNAEVVIMVVNWADLSMGHFIEKTGTTGVFTMRNGLLTSEIRGLAHKCTALLGGTYGPVCRAEFGSGLNGIDMNSRWLCMFDVTTVRETGSVSSVIDARRFVPTAGLTPTADWFNDGFIEFTSGELDGQKFEVKDWDGTTLELFLPMPVSPESSPPDTFTIEPGCNKTLPDCRDKFDNVINRDAEDFIPGMDQILNFPNAN